MLLCARYVLPVTAKPISSGAVLVTDGKIMDIGPADMLRLKYPDEEIMDFGMAALMPGLVDLYTRLENSVMRGTLNDVPFATWLVALAEKSMLMEAPDWYDSAILGGLDSLSSGITTVADITATGAACSAVQKLGLRGVFYRETGAMDKNRMDFAIHQAKHDIEEWQSQVDPERISIGIAPAVVFMNHPSMFGRISELAVQLDLPVALRLAGNMEEYNFVMYGSSPFAVHAMDNRRGFVENPPWMPTGVTPVRYALNWGAFEAPHVMVIHGVCVTDEDIQKMREYDVSVCLCPRANAQLGCGIAPMSEYMRAGLRVGLGTDSPAATDSTDMLQEMQMGMLLQRATNRRQFLDTATMLELATIGGAQALGLDDKIGSLEIGKCADIIAIDLSSSHQAPTGNPVSAIVNTCTAADVIMTMVDGKVLYEKNQWHVDVEVRKNIARVIEIRGKLRV